MKNKQSEYSLKVLLFGLLLSFMTITGILLLRNSQNTSTSPFPKLNIPLPTVNLPKMEEMELPPSELQSELLNEEYEQTLPLSWAINSHYEGNNSSSLAGESYNLDSVKFRYSTYEGLFTAPAENGDFYNKDNDGDGRLEPIHVKGYTKKDGTYVKGHYRARPKK
eukprot:GHVU01203915.1.p1 GENE.GHVU01203915.1~~GHVU01203915.1.p1  ORF type:complete len:165 (+),score=14.69 GHVU01203915.1:319-813(+)